MVWFWMGVAVLLSVPAAVTSLLVGLHFYLRVVFIDNLTRIFREKPLFIIPRGEPIDSAEDLQITTDDGLTLRGCYIRGKGPRRGVILFGLEFGSTRWSCLPYCASLLDAGFDVFTYEPRNQGESDSVPGYEPMQWVTRYEVMDLRTALRYLKKRPEVGSAGIGFFGISRGANAGLIVAPDEPLIRCLVTDGAFGIYSVVVPYMRKWISIYDRRYFAHGLMPSWYYGLVARVGIRKTERELNVQFEYVENSVRRLHRPLLMIHGEADTYIKVEMAKVVYDRATGEKEFWLVPGAKHNQALHVAGDAYRQRIRDFFCSHFPDGSAKSESAV